MTLVWGCDVSNYQPADLGPLIAQHKPQHVVVRLSTESQHHLDIARQQLATARQAGCTLGGYIWAYWGEAPEQHAANALSVAEGFDLQMVAIDCEDEDPGLAKLEDWLARAVAQLESQGQRCWVYSSRGWWTRNGDSHGFVRLPLWVAQYDGIPELDIVGLFGGWTEAAGKQWSDQPIDRDVFDAAVIRPPDDPCAALRNGLRAELARKRLSRKRLAALLA